MAKKIIELDDPTIPLNGNELIEMSQSNVSVKVTVDELLSKILLENLHNELGGLQGGDSTALEFYHLNAQLYNQLSSTPTVVLFSGDVEVAGVRFREDSGNGSNIITLISPDAVTTDRTWILPQDDPTTAEGKFLTTDSTGALSFTTIDDAIPYPLLAPNGGLTVPSYSFANDTDTGLYLSNVGVLNITVGSTLVAEIASNQFNIKGSARFTVNGGQIRASSTLSAATAPAYAFLSDTNTGFFSPSSDDVGVSLGGYELFRFEGGNATNTTNGLLHFYEAPTNGPDSVSLQAPIGVATSRTWTLPQDDPITVEGQFLTTDATGIMSFAVAFSGIVDDTSPQLGGDLDTLGYNIVQSVAGELDIIGHANGAGAGGKTRVYGGSGSTNGGDVYLSAGAGSANGGVAYLKGGNGAAGNGGDVYIDGGTGTGWGGTIRIRPGADTSGTDDGTVIIYGGVTNGADMRFLEGSANGTRHVDLNAPDDIATNRAWILPQDDPTTAAGGFLTTDAAGVLSFIITGGQEAISLDATSVIVTFDSTSETDYYPVCLIENEIDSPPAFYNLVVINKTINGFTVLFDSSIDSSNYKLNWKI